MLVSELAEVFLSSNQNTFQGNTLRAYRSDLVMLAETYPNLDAREVTAQHLRAFLNAAADLAPSTLARRQASLRSCFAWAYRNEVVDADPTGRLEPVKVPQRDPRPLTEEHVEAVLAAIPTDDRRNRLLFTMLYETGMRVGEALGIHAQHVHLNDVDGGYIRIIGKGNKERMVPLIDAPRTVRLLREILKKVGALGPLFRGELKKGGRTSKAVEYPTIYYHFERYLSTAREKRPALFEQEAEPITIHRLRHTYASSRLRDGVSLPSVRKLMGHKNLQTTLRYAETDLETIKQELAEARRRRQRK